MSDQYPPYQQPYGQPQQPRPTQPLPQEPGHHARRQRSLPVLIIAVGAPALLIGAALGAAGTLWLNRPASKPATTSSPNAIPISGTVTLNDGFGVEGLPCSGEGGYGDIREGAQVVVTDAASKTLAVGALGPGRRDAKQDCEFAFSVTAPSGQQFYGLEISHRGRLQYSAAQVSKPLQLSLGD